MGLVEQIHIYYTTGTNWPKGDAEEFYSELRRRLDEKGFKDSVFIVSWYPWDKGQQPEQPMAADERIELISHAHLFIGYKHGWFESSDFGLEVGAAMSFLKPTYILQPDQIQYQDCFRKEDDGVMVYQDKEELLDEIIELITKIMNR